MTYDHSGRISDSGHVPVSRRKWADDSSGGLQKIINWHASYRYAIETNNLLTKFKSKGLYQFLF
jgi:hypothetical protein